MKIGIDNTTYLTFLACVYLVFIGVIALIVSKIYKKSLKESATSLFTKGIIPTIRAERSKNL
jgi:ABC-type dipeptide/oligopeptide/nickel transport system permease component